MAKEGVPVDQPNARVGERECPFQLGGGGRTRYAESNVVQLPPSLPPTVPAQGRVRAGAPHASLSDLHRHSLVRSDSLIPRTAPLTADMANFPMP